MPNIVLSHMSKWFTSNNLALNPDIINVINFKTNYSPQYASNIGYSEKHT
jgi:hypothetical protein